jgi:flagellar protein FliO/FliZ
MKGSSLDPDSPPSVMQISPALKSAGAAVLGLLLLAPATLAADGESTPLDLSQPKAKAAESAGSSAGGGLVRTIVGLAIVIGVIYGLYWVLKQVKNSREDKASGAGLKTLATLPLGQNRAMHLVRAGDEVVLVGVGEGGVTPIRTYGEHEARALGLLADDEELPELIELPAAAAEPRPNFLEALRRKTVIK